MADEKVYTPQVVEDMPFPQDGETELATTQSTSNNTYSPKEIKDTPIPRKVIAHETIASSLNTKSRKILQEYQFTEHGAIQIGKYENGVSGDIRITPSGITARDTAGNTTVGIDGETGDSTFKGVVQAGSFIAGGGAVRIEESSAGNGRIVLYNGGIPAILIGDPD